VDDFVAFLDDDIGCISIGVPGGAIRRFAFLPLCFPASFHWGRASLIIVLAAAMSSVMQTPSAEAGSIYILFGPAIIRYIARNSEGFKGLYGFVASTRCRKISLFIQSAWYFDAPKHAAPSSKNE
jgi:hypothetical protein